MLKNNPAKKIFLATVLTLIFLTPGSNLMAGTPPPPAPTPCDPQTQTCCAGQASNGGYCLLEPIGGITEVGTSGTQFSDYLQTIVNLAVMFTGIISVIMFIIGGVEYVFSSVSEAAKKDAKDRMTNSILGIVVALAGYLLLGAINPSILTLNFPTTHPTANYTGIEECVHRAVGAEDPRTLGPIVLQNFRALCRNDINAFNRPINPKDPNFRACVLRGIAYGGIEKQTLIATIEKQCNLAPITSYRF